MKIDAHQHFWRFTPADYGWIDDQMSVLRRNFLPGDLQREIAVAGIDSVVTVQARQSLAETEWLLKLAAEHPFIAGVVGWVPLAASDVEQHLERFSKYPALKAVRHVVQDEPNEQFLKEDRFNAGVSLLNRYGLAYDILIYDRQLPQAIEFVDRHPNQPFVLDHLAKPTVSRIDSSSWSLQIRDLARRENVMCKVSGLATQMSRSDWTFDDMEPYLETILNAFGPRRLMFGSDWPVCLLATDYNRWYQTIARFANLLTADERNWLFGKSASQAYKTHPA